MNFKLSLFGGLLFLLCAEGHALDVREAPIGRLGTATSVSISSDTALTTAWTAIPSTTTRIEYGAGVMVSDPATNNAAIVCVYGSKTQPSLATSIRPIEIEKGENPFFPIGPNVYLWCISKHTAAESVFYQEVGQ